MSGWPILALSEIATIGAGNSAPQDPKLFQDGTVPFFRTSDVGRVRFGHIERAEDLLNSDGQRGLRLWPPTTILFPKSGASTFLNHRVMMDVEACVASHLATIVAKPDRVLPAYLLYFLHTIRAQDLTQDHNYPSLRLPEIGAIKVPLPPLTEQKRIVAILDEAFEGIAKATANAERNLANARELFLCELEAIFAEGRKTWIETTVGAIGRVQTGNTPPAALDGAYGNLIPFIKPGDFRPNGDLNYDNDGLSARGVEASRVFESNSALMVCIGATIGKTGYADRPVAANQQVNAVTPRAGVSGRFVFHQMRSSSFQAAVLKSSSQATLPIINKGKWSALPVWIPASEALQNEIVMQLDALEVETASLALAHSRKLVLLAELKQSLLHKAFSGQLTGKEAIAA